MDINSTDKVAPMLTDFQNLYEVRKTIRFNLLPVKHREAKVSDEQFRLDLKAFIERYKQVIAQFSALVFSRDEGDEQILNPDTNVSHSWLQQYAKQDFHTNKGTLVKRRPNKKTGKDQKTNTNVSLREAPFLLDMFQSWVEKNWKEKNIATDTDEQRTVLGIVNQLGLLESQPMNSRERKSDCAYWVHQIRQRSNFEFIDEFSKNIRGTKSDVAIDEIKIVVGECKKLLESLDDYLLPSQSFGQVIERASLNYYTVNKRQKNYSQDIQDWEKKFQQFFRVQKFLEQPQRKNEQMYREGRKNKKSYNEETVKNSKRGEYLKQSGFEQWKDEKIGRIILKDLYTDLKKYKAEQKPKFFEYVSKQKSFEMVAQDVPLFVFENITDEHGNIKKTAEQQFQEFYDTCIVIQEKSTKYEQHKNPQLKQEITSLKKARGEKYFNVQNKDCPFPRYIILCELFKEVATEYGKIKAEIKSVEKERIDAERLQSWAVLLKKENQHYIMTIPRARNIQNAYKEIKQLRAMTGENPWILYHFESLTFRALEKLCFGMDKNTFLASDTVLWKELCQDSPHFFEMDFGKVVLKRKDQFVDEKDLVQFYQTVLSLKATTDQILIKEYLADTTMKEAILKDNFVTLEDFQIALEKICYIRKEVRISEEQKLTLETKYGASVYQITSYDLYQQRKNEEEHTKLWKRFWDQDETSGYPTRLNPELTISYVEKRAESIRDKGGSEVGNNRRKQVEYILSTTVSEHNDRPKFDMAFADKAKVIENINTFNETLNAKIKADPYGIYYYGIDRGQEELLTLGIFQFFDEDISFTNPSTNISGEYKKPVPVDLEVWELPEGKISELVPYETGYGTKYTEAYKNISYAEHLLEKKTIQSCLDLTCAKLIKGKIVVNGDMATFMNLKMVNAQRTMDAYVNDIMSAKKVEVCHRQKSKKKNEHLELVITLENGTQKTERIYWIHFGIERESVQAELEKYIKTMQSKQCNEIALPIDRINHLRDAICANAVGIINFLQQEHFGLIAFEDLVIEQREDHFRQNNTTLGSRVEIMLLNKFKTLGLVPPNYKMAMSMQSKKEINQLGIMTYVRTEGSSIECPHCGQFMDGKTKRNHKQNLHRFRCCCEGETCGFSTYSQEEIDQYEFSFPVDHKGFDFLRTSDDVATYNIAKRGFGKYVKIK